MLISSLEGEIEARAVSVDNSKLREDLKSNIQMPDYDDCQCYDLGVDVILSQIAYKNICQFLQAIVANFETSPVYGEKS